MVKRVIQLMYSEIKGLHQAAYILALFAFGSQLLALIRDRLLTHTFGAGLELDLYYTAFKIPDLLFVLFASVLSVYVLLPFVTKAKLESNEAAQKVLSQTFTIFIAIYLALAAIIFMATPTLITYLFPGFQGEVETLTWLIRILLIQPFLLGISSLFGVVTQLSKRFVIYAISPLIYNLGIIGGILFLFPSYGLSGLVAGVVLGALGHVLVQWPLLRGSELSFGLVRNFDKALLKSICLVAIPRAFTLSVHQVTLLALVGMATLMTPGSVAVFQLAHNLQSVPLSIIGVSYSVAAFPVLADLFSQKKLSEFTNHLLTAFRHIIFWSLPIIALVIVLRAQIVRVVFGSGEFNWHDTKLTAAALALFIVSLLGQAILLLLTRSFYAAGNTKTPFFVALFGSALTISTALVLTDLYSQSSYLQNGITNLLRLELVPGTEVLALAMAFVFGVMVETVILLILSGSKFLVPFVTLGRQLLEACIAGLAAGITSYATLNFVVYGINQETFMGILIQGGIAGILGLLAAILSYHLLGSKELKEIYRSYHSKIFKTDIIAPQQETL